MQPRHLMMLFAAMISLQSATAATAAAIANTAGPMGLRIVNTGVIRSEAGVAVEATISRSRLTRVLSPQQLQINLVKTDGSIAATETRLVSAADLVRLNSRDYHMQVSFADLPLAEDYSVSVRWL